MRRKELPMSETLKMDLFGMTQYDDFVEKFRPKKTTDDCYTKNRPDRWTGKHR